jgi:hypothetical protein
LMAAGMALSSSTCILISSIHHHCHNFLPFFTVHSTIMWLTIDRVWIGNWIYCPLKITIALLLIHTHYNLLWHTQTLLSLLCLHQLSPGSTPNAVEPLASVFHDSRPCCLAPISQLIRSCYATVHNSVGSSTSHISTRGDCPRWDCLPTTNCRLKNL